MKRSIVFLLSLCMLLITCSDSNDPIKEIENKDPFITLKKSNVDFTNEGGEEAIVIESNVNWTAKSSDSWCTVSPTSGNKSTESITLSAPANKDYDNRSCTVTIEGGGVSKTITVNQGENLGLLVTQDRYELSNEESTIKVEVKANVEFEVETNDEWITQIETRGLTTSEIEFKIAENDTYSNRDGSITIKQKGGDMESTITIFQSQEDAIILTEKNFELSSNAQSVEVELKTNIEYEIIIPEDAKDWVTHATTRSLRTETVVLDIADNKDYDERTAEIIVKDKKTDLQETVTIKQVANRGLIISDDKYEVSNDGGIIDVEVKANVEFDIEISDNWITQVNTRGLTETKLQFQVAKNKTYDNREGTITIKEKGGNLSSTIKVYQSQEDAIILTEKEFELTNEAQSVEVELKTNIDYEIIIPEAAKSWVSYIETRALRTETVVLDIAENTDYDERTVEIIVKDRKTDLQETVTINQMGKELEVYYVEKMGTLGSMLNQTQMDTITTMIVKGEINKADFDVMKSKMPNLKYIDLKEVKCEGDKIPDKAFGDNNYDYANKNINTIILPESITTIGDQAFANCRGLTGNLILPDGLTTIGESAFYLCFNFSGNLVIPNGVTSIGENAFRGCSNFTGNLILPDGLKTIGEWAFYKCTGFKGNLILPDGLTTIGEFAFFECSNFTGDLIIPGSVTTIGKQAFWHCSRLTGDLIISKGVTSIGERAFEECSNFKGNLILPDGLTTIGGGAFNGCSGFTGKLNLPDGLTTIEWAAFGVCTGFTGNLIIPDGVTIIGGAAFWGCSGLTGLTLGKNVTTIYEEAFRGCTNITGNVVFPASLTSIKDLGFWGCSKVDAFQFPHTSPLGYNRLMLEKSVPVKVPNAAVSAYQSAYGWKEHTIIGY